MKNGNYILVKAPEDFPGKKYRGRYCLEHHLVYWQKYGVVPNKDQIIHHINEDRFDNRVENLKLESRSKHSKYHSGMRGRKYLTIICPNCGKEFDLPYNRSFAQKGYSYTCCSESCKGEFSHKIRKLPDFNAWNTVKKEFRKYGSII